MGGDWKPDPITNQECKFQQCPLAPVPWPSFLSQENLSMALHTTAYKIHRKICYRLLILRSYDRASWQFLVNKTNRRTEFQFYWYFGSTCFGQSFCPSSGVLSRTSALVHFMQIWWPFATRGRTERSSILLLVTNGLQNRKQTVIITA
jgi:hypothetical protein